MSENLQSYRLSTSGDAKLNPELWKSYRKLTEIEKNRFMAPSVSPRAEDLNVLNETPIEIVNRK